MQLINVRKMNYPDRFEIVADISSPSGIMPNVRIGLNGSGQIRAFLPRNLRRRFVHAIQDEVRARFGGEARAFRQRQKKRKET